MRDVNDVLKRIVYTRKGIYATRRVYQTSCISAMGPYMLQLAGEAAIPADGRGSDVPEQEMPSAGQYHPLRAQQKKRVCRRSDAGNAHKRKENES